MIKTHTRGEGAFKRFVACSLLASMIASLAFVAPAMAADTAAPAVVAASADDVAQANPFKDVPSGHWAYQAVSQLAQSGLVTGYPDDTYKGNREVTRYEMAVVINRAVNSIQTKMAQGNYVSQSDLAAVRRLVDAFGPELKQVEARLAQLAAAQAALKTQADKSTADITALTGRVGTLGTGLTAETSARTALATKLTADEAALAAAQRTLQVGKVTPGMWFRTGEFWEDVRGTNGPNVVAGVAPNAQFFTGQGGGTSGATQIQGSGAALPANVTISFGSGHGGTTQNNVQFGPYSHGFTAQYAQFTLSGQSDPRIQWEMRLEAPMRYNLPYSDLTSVTNGVCTGSSASASAAAPGAAALVASASSCVGGGNQANGLNKDFMALSYANFGYFAPSGFYAKIGRVGEGEGPYNADGFDVAGGKQNGIMFGYRDKRLDMMVFPTFIASALTNASNSVANASSICPKGVAQNCTTLTSQGLVAQANYWFPASRTAIGVTYNNYTGQINTEWNPYAGLCTATGAAGTGTTTVNVSTQTCPAGSSYITSTSGPAGPVTGAYQTVGTSIAGGSAWITQMWGKRQAATGFPQFKMTVELQQRFGNDPLSKYWTAPGQPGTSKWVGNNTLSGDISFASQGNLTNGPLTPGTGVRNSNVLQLRYFNVGQNGLAVEGGPDSPATPIYNLFAANYQGLQALTFTAQHWWTANIRTGLTFNRNQLARGITSLPGGSTTCPGCYISQFDARSLFLDTYMTF